MTFRQIIHPLVEHKINHLRSVTTPASVFRQLVKELSQILAYEMTRSSETQKAAIQTPLETFESHVLKAPPVIISILRAGNGLAEGMLEMLPNASVGHIGMYRDERHKPVSYFFKVPTHTPERTAILVDPLLATGHSAAQAIAELKERANPTQLQFACLIAAPEGLKYLQETHPDVEITCAMIDRELNTDAYILPGLGDAGDRFYKTC